MCDRGINAIVLVGAAVSAIDPSDGNSAGTHESGVFDSARERQPQQFTTETRDIVR